MSAGPTGRAHRWGVWLGRHGRDGLRIVAFEHQCGSITRLPDYEEQMGDISCSGCRFSLDRPEECTPLYVPERETTDG